MEVIQGAADRQRERRFDPVAAMWVGLNLQTVLPEARDADRHLSAVKGRDGDAGLVRKPNLSRLRVAETAVAKDAEYLPKRHLEHLYPVPPADFQKSIGLGF